LNLGLKVAFAAASAAAVAPAFAQAQADTTNPYYFGANVGLTHVSNVFQQSSSRNADDVLTGNLLGGIDTRFGREHLRLDGSVGTSRYRNNTALNNVGYQGSAALDWSTIERVSGTITAGASRQLASYNISPYITQVPDYVNNTLSSYYVDALTHVGLVTRWTLDADVSYRQYRYSAAQYAQLNYQQTAYSLGPSYQASPDLRIGVDWRHTNATNPTYFPVYDPASNPTSPTLTGYDPNHYSRNDIDLNIHWRFSGFSSLDTRLSHGSYTHADSRGQSTSNFSGAATWNWTPTGKTTIVTSFIHDSGLSAYVFSNLPFAYNTNQSTVTNTLQVNANYQLTGKMTLTAAGVYARTNRSNDAQFGNESAASNSHDNYYSLLIGANWQYSRGISMACQVGHQVRTSTIINYGYDADSIGCNAQILFY
jgi:hypothetical protein